MAELMSSLTLSLSAFSPTYVLLCSKKIDSDEQITEVQPSNIASGSLDNACRRDPTFAKGAAEDATPSLMQDAERDISDSSDLPRLLQLHELCYLVCRGSSVC